MKPKDMVRSILVRLPANPSGMTIPEGLSGQIQGCVEEFVSGRLDAALGPDWYEVHRAFFWKPMENWAEEEGDFAFSSSGIDFLFRREAERGEALSVWQDARERTQQVLESAWENAFPCYCLYFQVLESGSQGEGRDRMNWEKLFCNLLSGKQQVLFAVHYPGRGIGGIYYGSELPDEFDSDAVWGYAWSISDTVTLWEWGFLST